MKGGKETHEVVGKEGKFIIYSSRAESEEWECLLEAF